MNIEQTANCPPNSTIVTKSINNSEFSLKNVHQQIFIEQFTLVAASLRSIWYTFKYI